MNGQWGDCKEQLNQNGLLLIQVRLQSQERHECPLPDLSNVSFACQDVHNRNISPWVITRMISSWKRITYEFSLEEPCNWKHSFSWELWEKFWTQREEIRGRRTICSCFGIIIKVATKSISIYPQHSGKTLNNGNCEQNSLQQPMMNWKKLESARFYTLYVTHF